MTTRAVPSSDFYGRFGTLTSRLGSGQGRGSEWESGTGCEKFYADHERRRASCRLCPKTRVASRRTVSP
jgi:hypothetical protein